MANSFENAVLIAKQSLVEFDNEPVLAQSIYRDYESDFGPKASGDLVTIRRPLEFTPVSGRVATPQDLTDASVQIRVDQEWNISYAANSFDFTLKEDEMAERFTKPLVKALGNRIEQSCMSLYYKIPAWVGTPGQVVNSYADYMAPVTYLTECAVPADGRMSIMTPTDYSAMVVSAAALMTDDAVNPALRSRDVKRLAGTKVSESTLVPRHTVGALGGTPLVKGASQNVTYTAATANHAWSSSLIVDGWTASITNILRAGDVFTIAGVYAVNPVTKQAREDLQMFTVLADATSNASGETTLTISPPIISAAGAYQTVSAAPADNAAITVKGTAATPYRQNLMYHKNALALAMVPKKAPEFAVKSTVVSYKGFSIRVTGGFDVTNDIDTIRYDILFGVDVINPKLAARFSGAP